VLIEGVTTSALIDTGSQITTIALSLVQKIDCEMKALNNLTVHTAGGNILPYLGYVELTLELAPGLGIPMDILALVIDDSKCDPNVPVVIGTNVLDTAYDSLMVVRDTLNKPLSNALKFMSRGDLNGVVGHAKSTRVEVLPPKSKILVSGITRAAAHCSPINVVSEESPHFHLPGGVLVSQCVVQAGGPGSTSRVYVELVNTTDRQRRIPAGVVLCNLLKVNVLPVNYSSHSVADEHWLDQFSWPEDPEQAEAVRGLVKQWREVFSVHNLDYGRTDLVEHKINLVDETPISFRHRRIPPAMYDEVRAYLDELLAAEQIRPSHSPWSFPLVLVRKKQGGLRLCIDYRRLNERCIRDIFPLPRLDETMDSLIGARYFSRLDLRSGYYQVPMYEPHKERTAFSAGPIGKFEWNSMPMGTVNATSTFQRLMQQCLGSMHLKECVVFLDDILVYSSTLEEHLVRLGKVFQRLKDCGLKLKPSKCEFMKAKCNYLGHVVSAEGVSTDPEKIEKVLNWKVPGTAKELASFLGFTGFYRRYVEKFSSVARPLQELLKSSDGKSPLVWSKEANESFEALKVKLTSAPILAYADCSQPFILHVDASGKGLGAVLYQLQDGKRRVIAYASRGLNAAERNYPAHKREFLALKWAITDKFHDYLYGNKCDVFTDSNPLTYVLSSAKLDATGHRWLAQLSAYDFAVHYKPGQSHVDADALSRLDNDVSRAICGSLQTMESGFCHTLPLGVGFENDVFGTEVVSSVFDGDASLRQEEDSVLSVVKQCVKENVKLTGEDWNDADTEVKKLLNQRDKLKIVNDILYRAVQGDQGEVLQYLVPHNYRRKLFQSLHEDMGHPGRDKTLTLHRERCYWPSIAKDVEDMVRKCRRCVCRKARTTTAPLTPIVTSQPLELVCLDYLLVEPSAGYEHLLVITDHFTKFAKVIPTRNETAVTTARALYDNFITVYGIPQRIHSDQGRCFESKIIKELCLLTGMQKSRTTPFHPMGNGGCERFNSTLLKLIGTLANDQKSKWKSHLPSLVHAYNCTPHNSTGFSPYELMFGRKPMLPVDAEIKPRAEGERNLTKFVEDLRKQVEYVNSIAKKKMEVKAANSKESYDLKSTNATLEIGDTVLVRKTAVTGREKVGDKWVDEVYVVISRPNPEVAVYTVKPVGGE
jgi:transposase InsO family protein